MFSLLLLLLLLDRLRFLRLSYHSQYVPLIVVVTSFQFLRQTASLFPLSYHKNPMRCQLTPNGWAIRDVNLKSEYTPFAL